MKTLKVLELFGGIGACSSALSRLHIPYEIVDYVEIDKYAVKSFNAIHNTNFEPQDIKTWDKDIKVDLIMHGSPCQDFSLAGKQAGGDEGSGTRSSLMYETIRIVKKLKPKYVVWENVKNLLSKKHRHNFDAYLKTMEELGYTSYYQVLNAKDYGIPQNRERVFTISILGNNDFEFPQGNECDNNIKVVGDYMPSGYDSSRIVDENGIAPTVKENHGTVTGVAINFTFPPKQELKLKLKDLLEDEVDEKYYLSNAMLNYCLGVNQKESKFPRKERFLSNINRKNQDIANSITTNAGNRPTDNFLKIKNNTKKGYLEGYEGDGVYINTTTKRGTVQHGMIQTLTTFQDKGVVVKDDTFVSKKYKKFVDENGYIPDMFNPYNETEIKDIAPTQSTYCNSCTSSASVLIKNKRLNSLVEKTNFEEGKVLNLDLYNQTTNENISQCLTEPHHNSQRLYDGLRIRKLTPKECWRLMGFTDEEFEKAKQVNSDTQLYKQAGNSIVVNVLMEIFKNLFHKEYMESLLKGL